MKEDDSVEEEAVAEAPPINELRDFELEPDPEFTERVRSSIDRKEVATSAIELSTQGFFSLVLGYVATFFSYLFSDPDAHDGEEKP